MYHLWFERQVPPAVAAMLASKARYTDGDYSSTVHIEGIGEADGIIAAARLRYDAALMDKAPRLRVISRTGAGYDNVDVAAATARGIVVCNTPDAVTRSTAEHSIALILAAAKDLKRISIAMAEAPGDYLNRHRGIELQGKVLGLVGIGRIGAEVGRMAACLGMEVLAYDPVLSPERALELQFRHAGSLQEVLEESDIVSLHVPYSAQNRYLISAVELASMKTGALLVNCSRGGVVDEAALLTALDEGKLMGAALDVLEKEPPSSDYALLHRRDVLVTPHIAVATDAGLKRLWETAVAQALQVLEEQQPPHMVNPEVWPRRRRDGERP